MGSSVRTRLCRIAAAMAVVIAGTCVGPASGKTVSALPALPHAPRDFNLPPSPRDMNLPPAPRWKPGLIRRAPSGEIVLVPVISETPRRAGTDLGGYRQAAAEMPLVPRVQTAEARQHRVCPRDNFAPGCQFDELAKALAAAGPKDIIVLAPGIYRQAALVTVPGVTIRGEPGAHLKGRAFNGKAALVIRADDVVIDGIECSNIAVRDRNGACIRIEGRNLTVRNVYFHDNQEGILGGKGGTLLVENSRFERNGFNTGQAHGLYISRNVKEFIFRNNRILATKNEGQGLKSRAQRTIIENNIIASLDGRDSRAIDLPDGGDVIIRGNILQKGPNSANSQMIGVALERRLNAVHKTLIENNLIIFDQDRPQWIEYLNDVLGLAPPRGVVVYSRSPGRVILRGNTIVGARSIGSGVTETGNRMFSSRRSAELPDAPELPALPQ